MPSKIIEQQLKNCVFADLRKYDAENNIYYIPRYTKPQYSIGKCYLIKLPGNIVNNPNSILATNWNNGTTPKHESYKAYVSKLIGKVAYMDCLAFDWENKVDLNDMWSGYLDTDELTQLGEIS